MSLMPKDLKEVVKTLHSSVAQPACSYPSSCNSLFVEQEDHGDHQLQQPPSTASYSFTSNTITSSLTPPGSSRTGQPPASVLHNPQCCCSCPDEEHQDPLPTAKFLTSCCLTGDLPPFFYDYSSANKTPRPSILVMATARHDHQHEDS